MLFGWSKVTTGRSTTGAKQPCHRLGYKPYDLGPSSRTDGMLTEPYVGSSFDLKDTTGSIARPQNQGEIVRSKWASM
jgi:hypothetical protein